MWQAQCYLAWQTLNNQVRLIITIWQSFQPWAWCSLCSYPSPGNNLANLRMMIRAAKTIAEDLGGVVLTDQQEIFDDMAEQDYLSRIA